MDKPDDNSVMKHQVIQCYIQTLTKFVGSEEDKGPHEEDLQHVLPVMLWVLLRDCQQSSNKPRGIVCGPSVVLLTCIQDDLKRTMEFSYLYSPGFQGYLGWYLLGVHWNKEGKDA